MNWLIVIIFLFGVKWILTLSSPMDIGIQAAVWLEVHPLVEFCFSARCQSNNAEVYHWGSSSSSSYNRIHPAPGAGPISVELVSPVTVSKQGYSALNAISQSAINTTYGVLMLFPQWSHKTLYRTHRYELLNFGCIMKPIFTLEICLQSQGTRDKRLSLLEEIQMLLDMHISIDRNVSFNDKKQIVWQYFQVNLRFLLVFLILKNILGKKDEIQVVKFKSK